MRLKVLDLINEHKTILAELIPDLKVTGPIVVTSADGKTAEIHQVDPVGGYTVHPFPVKAPDLEAEVPDPAPAPIPAADPTRPRAGRLPSSPAESSTIRKAAIEIRSSLLTKYPSTAVGLASELADRLDAEADRLDADASEPAIVPPGQDDSIAAIAADRDRWCESYAKAEQELREAKDREAKDREAAQYLIAEWYAKGKAEGREDALREAKSGDALDTLKAVIRLLNDVADCGGSVHISGMAIYSDAPAK